MHACACARADVDGKQQNRSSFNHGGAQTPSCQTVTRRIQFTSHWRTGTVARARTELGTWNLRTFILFVSKYFEFYQRKRRGRLYRVSSNEKSGYQKKSGVGCSSIFQSL